MNILLFVLVTYLLGFITAIPVGATQIEIAKRSLNNNLRAAYMVAAGSVCSDVMYGFIALFGIAPFLKDKMIVAIFDLAAALFMWVLAFFTFRAGAKANILDIQNITLKSKRISFVTGFSLAVTNPPMIVWWLIGVKIIKDLNLVSEFDTNVSLIFLIVGGLGLFTYLFMLANVLHWVKKFVTSEAMRKVNYGLGIVLILLSFYFLSGSLKIFLGR